MTPRTLRQHLANEYGGISPFGLHAWHSILHLGGCYRRLSAVKLAACTRLVFVCKGNICRSPYAELKARQLGLHAISAGLDTTPGKPADEHAIDTALTHKIDLSPHRTQLLSKLELTPHDLIFVMEPGQLEQAQQQIGTLATPVSLMGIYAKPSRPYLQDPYGKNGVYFDRCYEAIDSALVELQSLLISCRPRPQIN